MRVFGTGSSAASARNGSASAREPFAARAATSRARAFLSSRQPGPDRPLLRLPYREPRSLQGPPARRSLRHEALGESPYDGVLISKVIVDGMPFGGSGKYTMAQRQRLYREGARAFFRLARPDGRLLASMGDSGAFAYVREPEPPLGVEDVIAFYEGVRVDFGISVDHIVLGFARREQDLEASVLANFPPPSSSLFPWPRSSSLGTERRLWNGRPSVWPRGGAQESYSHAIRISRRWASAPSPLVAWLPREN